MLAIGAEPAGPAVESGLRGGERSTLRDDQLWEPFKWLDDVTGFFVRWPPPPLSVLTLSALRSGDARALDLSLAASHRA
jgi:hypothetical protein